MQKKREYFLGPIERYSQSLYRVCMKTNTSDIKSPSVLQSPRFCDILSNLFSPNIAYKIV